MNRLTLLRTVPVVLLVGIATGCANKDKQTIAMLEENNQDLTERLNRAMSDLNAADAQYDGLDQQMQAALRDAEQCRAQLAAQPAPAQPAYEEPAPGWTAVPGGAMIAIEGNVLFAPGKTVVRDQGRRTLDAIISTIKGEYGDKDIIVVGHTDDQPIKKSGWKDNWQLSTERALAVVRYMQDHGVSPDRLIAAGCGEHRPKIDDSSAANRAANRRSEIFALDSQTMTGHP